MGRTSSYYWYIVKYKDNYYKHKYNYEYDGNEEKYIFISVSKISIDSSTFGVQDIGDGDSVLVTPSTPNNLIHGRYVDAEIYWSNQPNQAGPYYLNGEGNIDFERPFTDGFWSYENITMDPGFYYDSLGNWIENGIEFYHPTA